MPSKVTTNVTAKVSRFLCLASLGLVTVMIAPTYSAWSRTTSGAMDTTFFSSDLARIPFLIILGLMPVLAMSTAIYAMFVAGQGGNKLPLKARSIMFSAIGLMLVFLAYSLELDPGTTLSSILIGVNMAAFLSVLVFACGVD